ncbi:DNA polymerase III subunit delta [Clostridium aminobutyricum]|uniref:DNA polymerase III subunit delta n=1 Tax=Clostridium aminobutyricum TaxID=33953 RepID=A0A939D8J2_CLOAM|nr:DNA polymerase III subunit delta [Clostridium aminobutyricum]MBN7772748.1 DNA polymerase III subunit delta [Clostridium aminobutyricum]
MAYRKQTEKEHAFQTISKDLKADKIGPVVALFGREQYLVHWAAEQIVEKYINPACKEMDLSILEGEKTSLDSIKESCETFTMMSAKRVVLIKSFSLLEGSKMKTFSEDEEAQLIEYIKKVPSECMVILIANTADKRKKLYKAISENGQTYEFNLLSERDLISFIEKRFRASKKMAKPSVIHEFVNNSGYFHKEATYTLYNLENDIKKMIAYSEGEEILLSDVLATVSGNLETSVFAMLDAISVGRKNEAYILLNSLLTSGENLYMILSLIASQFETILEVKELKEEGKNLAEIQSILQIHEFRIKKAMSFADRYSIKSLKRILIKVYEIDRSIKTGLLEQSLALELFIAQI